MRALVAAVVILAGCDAAPARTVTIPIPNTPHPSKEGQIELTKYGQKVVITNHTDRRLWDCVVAIDQAIHGELGELPARQTVTLMRTRFRPYTEADVFYDRAKQQTILECTAAEGRVQVTFVGGPEYTAPVDALRPTTLKR